MYSLHKTWLLPVLFALSPLAAADELRVAVASNFVPVMQQLVPVFEAQSEHTIAIIGGASGRFYTQIANGAPFDVFLSADSERPTLLEQEGKGVPGSVFTYAIGTLVLWSAEADFVDAEGAVLKAGNFEHLSIANPKLAPYGEAAEEVLRAMEVWDTLQPKLVMGESITQALQFVESGNAQLGFIAKSQWLDIGAGSKGSAWDVPANLYTPIVQQGVLIRDTPAGKELIEFLQSEKAVEMIEAAGYAVP